MSTQTQASSPTKTAKPSAQTVARSRTIGRFVWFQLRTPDVSKAAAFYAQVVGWRTQSMDMGPNTVTLFANTNETVVHTGVVDGPAAFVSYVVVDNVDQSAARISSAGGRVLGTPEHVPHIGRMVEVEDPDGARFFLYRSTNPDAGQPAEHGGVIWNELWAANPKRALTFLCGVLGYTVEEMPMPQGPYHLLCNNNERLAGVMAAPAAKTSAWVPYIHVADVDAARAVALKLGAQAEGDAMTVDGVGRMAILTDPQGARFAVMTPAGN